MPTWPEGALVGMHYTAYQNELHRCDLSGIRESRRVEPRLLGVNLSFQLADTR